MFKRTIKLRIHNPKCDPRKRKFGNMTDLCINGDHTFSAPRSNKQDNIITFNNGRIGLGISMTLPKWYEARILPRSSTYGKWDCILSNGQGVIEWNYCEEWKAHLIPFDDIYIPDGTPILQYEVKLLPDAPTYMKIWDLFISGFKYKVVDVLTTTRGGFGSTDNLTQNLLICT